jgi:hypothetical protein
MYPAGWSANEKLMSPLIYEVHRHANILESGGGDPDQRVAGAA